MSVVYLSLGSNLGNKEENIKKAMELLGENKVIIEKTSSFYETEPVSYKKQDNFYNLVIKGETTLSPENLLKAIKKIERALGRKKTKKWGPREIDIDILLYDDCKINIPNLKIPHPQMEKRRFVLEPLREINSRVKIDGMSLREILSDKKIANQKIGKIKSNENNNKN